MRAGTTRHGFRSRDTSRILEEKGTPGVEGLADVRRWDVSVRPIVIYWAGMIKMLEEAIKKVRDLSEAEQDEAAAMLLSVASKNAEQIELDEGTRAAIQEGRQQAQDGQFVSDTDMAAFFRRHGVKRYGA